MFVQVCANVAVSNRVRVCGNTTAASMAAYTSALVICSVLEELQLYVRVLELSL